MSRINTNIQSLVATRVLTRNNAMLSQALERLSTGLKINSGKDDPAGLIASEALRNAKVNINGAINNANRANNVVSVAEGSLQEISSLLLELEDLVNRSANDAALSPDEITANQLQIDSILQSIDRISNTTEFAGRKLLNGNFDFTVSGTTESDARLDAIHINAARIPEGTSRTVTLQLLAPSEFAFVSAAGLGAGGILSAATTIQVRGNYGSEVLSLASGSTLTQIATAVNSSSELTGVSATVSGSSVFLTSTTFGSDSLVSVERLSGSISLTGGSDSATDYGVDGTATVNGNQAVVRGLNVAVRSASLSVDLLLDPTFAQTLASASLASRTASFDITGGGAVFAISPTLGLVGQETLGLQALTTGSLGNDSTGFLATLATGQTNDLNSKHFATAQRIIREATNQVASLRGRLGAFQKDTLETTVNALQVAFENTAAAESAIRDADFAVETSNLTRAQILVQSATATLQLSNAAPRNVLALLG